MMIELWRYLILHVWEIYDFSYELLMFLLTLLPIIKRRKRKKVLQTVMSNNKQ